VFLLVNSRRDGGDAWQHALRLVLQIQFQSAYAPSQQKKKGVKKRTKKKG